MVANFFEDAPQSVHLCSFPMVDESAIDHNLNKVMETALEVVVLGRSARNTANVKNRQPIQEMYVSCPITLDEATQKIILEELNVKRLVQNDDMSDFAQYEIKPQLRTLGPKYGKLLGGIRSYFANLGDEAKQLVATVKAGETYTFEVNGEQVSVNLDDLLISTKNKEGFAVVEDNGISVALDTELTQELLEEGLVREFVSKVQSMRKDCGFVVTDHIEIGYTAEDSVAQSIEKYAQEICSDTLADSVTRNTVFESDKQWDVNGHVVNIGVKVVKK